MDLDDIPITTVEAIDGTDATFSPTLMTTARYIWKSFYG